MITKMKINNPFQPEKIHTSAVFALALVGVLWFTIHQLGLSLEGSGAIFHLMLFSWGAVTFYIMLLPYGKWAEDNLGAPALILTTTCLVLSSFLAIAVTARWLYLWYVGHSLYFTTALNYQIAGVRLGTTLNWVALILAVTGAVYWDFFRRRRVSVLFGRNRTSTQPITGP